MPWFPEECRSTGYEFLDRMGTDTLVCVCVPGTFRGSREMAMAPQSSLTCAFSAVSSFS